MDQLGTDFNNSGSVMSRTELEALRQKRGECITCGRKCFKKKLFKMVPIDDEGRVLNGRCLNCNPLNPKENGGVIPAVSRPATQADLNKFNKSQQLLMSSRNVMSGVNGPPRRPLPSRAVSTFGRADGRSLGSSSTSSSRPNMGSRSRSMMPGPSSSFSESTPRGPTLPTISGGSQSLPTQSQPTARAASARFSGSAIAEEDFSGGSLRHSSHRGSSLMASSRSSTGSAALASFSSSQHGSERRTSVPTAEELQQAAMILEAAKKHGVSLHTERELDEHLEQRGEHQLHEGFEEYNDLVAERELGASHRSLRSMGSSGDLPLDVDDYDGPQHGVLNRGGSFVEKPQASNRQPLVNGGSRSLDGLDSDLGTLSSHHMISSTPIYDVYEHDEDSSHSRLSNGSRHSENSDRNYHEEPPASEQVYIDRIHRVGQDFGEVLVVLREAIDRPIVAREALEELARLQLTVEDYDLLADMAAPVLIADALQTHPNVMQVQLWGCGAIWNMSGTERNQLLFVRAGALNAILAAMDRFIDDVEVQEKAIATLSNLAAAEDNMPVLIDNGAVGRIVDAMNKHSGVGSIQIRGCAAVTNLASHDSPLKQQIMELGGGGAVVIAMVMHPDDFYLQEKALRALRNLCANCEENKLELANIGGIDAAISAMQVHRDEAGVQEEGSWTLSNLAGNDDNKAVIGDCGGIDVIIRAMWVHSENVGVQEWCTRALYTLTLDIHNGNVVLEVGGISAVVNAMQAHVDSPVVQEMGCAVLGNLAGTDQSKMRIVDEEALDAIVLAMVLHTDDMQVQERACMVLLRLAIPENVKSMAAANIPELALTAAQKFPDRCDVTANRLIDHFS